MEISRLLKRTECLAEIHATPEPCWRLKPPAERLRRALQLQQREGRWVIVDLIGKGGRVRSVLIAAWVKASVDRWLSASGIADGCVFRAVNKGGNVCHERMTGAGVHSVLKEYAAELAPHDLRRSFALAGAQSARFARADSAVDGARLRADHGKVPGHEAGPGRRTFRSAQAASVKGFECVYREGKYGEEIIRILSARQAEKV